MIEELKDSFSKVVSRLSRYREKLRSSKRYTMILLLVCAVLSMAVLSPIMSSTSIYTSVYETLDRQKDNISLLLVSASSASALITMLPDDLGTPIADKLADLSTYFLIALSVLCLGKFLLTTIAYILFAWVIPIYLGLKAWHIFHTQNQLYKLVKRIAVFFIALFFVIPVSAQICNGIETTFHDTIQDAIEIAAQQGDVSVNEKEDKSLWDSLNELISTVTNSVSNAIDWAKNILQQFLEATAVIMVTSCLVPLIVLLCVIKMAKELLKFDVALFQNRSLSPQR